MKSETSYYKILGVNENASNHELRKPFCKLSIELHPDTTTLEMGETSNGKEKNSKSIKQTFKWSK